MYLTAVNPKTTHGCLAMGDTAGRPQHPANSESSLLCVVAMERSDNNGADGSVEVKEDPPAVFDHMVLNVYIYIYVHISKNI